jgi:uncharacterized protein YjdB
MDTVTDQNTVAEIKAYLDAHDISYPSGATKADLLALVPEQQGTMVAAAEEPAGGTGESEEPTDTGTGDESTEPEQPAEPIKVSSFDLDKTDVAVDVGKEAKVNVTNVLPEDAADKTIVVTSNDETIATVMVHTDGSIGVQGVKEGITTADVKSNDGGVTKKLTITVKDPVVPVTGIAMAEDNATTGNVGTDIVLGAIISPENATNQNMDWVSSDESLAAFTKTGAPSGHKILSLLKAGQVIVTATTEDGSKSISQTIEITDLVPNEPELEPWEIMLINHDSTPHPAPPVDIYTVKTGDTLASIATEHMMSLARLKKLNGLTINVLPAGRIIRLS